MGEGLVRGLVSAGTVSPDRLIATDVRPERLDNLAGRFGVRVTADNRAAVSASAVVVLAVKPQQMAGLLAEVADLASRKLFISIAAGIPTGRIERELGGKPRVVRVMPNTPAQIGAGALALCRGSYATERDLELAEGMMRALGATVRVEEAAMDAVTALSGSGPAYVYLMAEAMIRAGVDVGLTEELSRKLALQTVLGAARLMASSVEDPAELRRRVTSPGGTTEAALKVLQDGRLVDLFSDAIRAAAARGRELSGT